MEKNTVFDNYKKYIDDHKNCVERGFLLLKPSLSSLLNNEEIFLLSKNVKAHDASKYQDDEFYPYAEHFFGDKQASKNDFEIAKHLHKSRNPHHPEYWKSKNEEMPKIYVFEMVLDWWSFGIMKNDPAEIFTYYINHKNELNLTDFETKVVNQVLSLIEQTQEQSRT